MKILFSLENQIHRFKVTGEIAPQDLDVLRDALLRFFESNPTYTILDMSESLALGLEKRLHTVFAEIESLVSSKNLNLVIAHTDAQAVEARNQVLELALKKQVEVLQAKLELREKMRADAEKLLAENAKLKENMLDQAQKLKELKQNHQGILSPLIEKLWSEK